MLWENEFECEEFEFDGRAAKIIYPPKGTENGKWMLKTEYFGAFPELEKQMLRRGYHLAYLKARERCGTDTETAAKVEFIKYISEKYGLSSKCIPIGMSCGGLQAIKLAGMSPESVSVLYLDAPVVNFMSWPFGLGNCPMWTAEKVKKELLDAYGLTMSTFISFREHPLDKIPILIENRIPAVLVYGDSDLSVPFDENGKLVKEAYEKTDIPFAAFCKPGCGHHPHALPDNTPVIEFLEKYS